MLIRSKISSLPLRSYEACPARYSTPSSETEQVNSINQFSDLRPTDWAYQALSNLVERNDCGTDYPDGKFRGNAFS